MINLTPWIILWAVVTTAVLVLGFYRLTLGLHEDPGMYLDPAEAPQAASKKAFEDRIAKVESVGKSLTALSAVLIVIVAMMWVYSALAGGSRLW